MEFKIGDRVKVNYYNELPDSLKNRSVGRLCGKSGKVVDKLWSVSKDCTVYKVLLDGKTVASSIDFTEDSISLIRLTLNKGESFKYEFDYCDNVVVAVLYEDSILGKKEVARGHGHIIHEGVEGIAQAASYALKRIYYKISDKNMKEEN